MTSDKDIDKDKGKGKDKDKDKTLLPDVVVIESFRYRLLSATLGVPVDAAKLDKAG